MLFNGVILVIDISLKTLHISLDIVHFVFDQLQLSFRLKSHVLNLVPILLVFRIDLRKFFVSILFNLLDGHLVSRDQFLIILLLFVNLSLLVLHLLLVLLFFEQDLVCVILLDFINGSEEVLMLTFFLSLKLGEFLGIIEHSTTILVAL